MDKYNETKIAVWCELGCLIVQMIQDCSGGYHSTIQCYWNMVKAGTCRQRWYCIRITEISPSKEGGRFPGEFCSMAMSVSCPCQKLILLYPMLLLLFLLLHHLHISSSLCSCSCKFFSIRYFKIMLFTSLTWNSKPSIANMVACFWIKTEILEWSYRNRPR